MAGLIGDVYGDGVGSGWGSYIIGFGEGATRGDFCNRYIIGSIVKRC